MNHNMTKFIFRIGEMLLYSNSGHSTYVMIIKIVLDYSGQMTIQIRTATQDDLNNAQETLR